jgi:undecaprenyl-diphosphatase
MLGAATSQGIYHMSYFQAIVIGIIQGFFELFPLSSLGHTVLIPSWFGGTWATLVHQESQSESPYLAFIVALHLANALALILFYLQEWRRLVGGFFTSLLRRRIRTNTQRLAWLIVIATIPVGLIGLELEHTFRTLFAKPVLAAVFLVCNGLILLAGEMYVRRRQREPGVLAADRAATARVGTVTSGPGDIPVGGEPGSGPAGDRQTARRPDSSEGRVRIDAEAEADLAGIGFRSALVIGASQALALFAGISREGVVMVGGLFRGLNRENALRFAFLLSTPVILAAGVLKVPDLLGSLGNGIRGQAAAGSVAAVLSSLVAINFLSRFFRTRTLLPFAAYSLIFGAISIIRFGSF